MKTHEALAILRHLNDYRRCKRNDMPEPQQSGEAIDHAIDKLMSFRASAKAVLKASNGTDEAAMDDALDQLRKALK